MIKPKLIFQVFAGMCCFFSGCNQQSVAGTGSGSIAIYYVPELGALYSTAFAFKVDATRAGESRTAFELLGPVVIWKSDHREDLFSVLNASEWTAGVENKTKTGILKTDSIYFIEKGRPPLEICKIPKERFTINGFWSVRAIGGVLGSELLLNEEGEIAKSFVRKLKVDVQPRR